MGRRTRDREAGHRDRVAPPWFRPLLGLEVEARGTPTARARDRRAHRANGLRQPLVEPSSNRERASETWLCRGQGRRREVHATSRATSTATAVDHMGYVRSGPPGRDSRHRLSHGADRDLRRVVRLLRALAGAPARAPRERHRAPARDVGRPAGGRGSRTGGACDAAPDSRPRRYLREGVQHPRASTSRSSTSSSRRGHRGKTDTRSDSWARCVASCSTTSSFLESDTCSVWFACTQNTTPRPSPHESCRRCSGPSPNRATRPGPSRRTFARQRPSPSVRPDSRMTWKACETGSQSPQRRYSPWLFDIRRRAGSRRDRPQGIGAPLRASDRRSPTVAR
jgi:hypothetical protein